MKMEDLVRSVAGDSPEGIIDEMLVRSRTKLKRALTQLSRRQVAVGIVQSSLGDLLVATTNRGVVLIRYVDHNNDVAEAVAKLRLVFDPVEDNRTVAAIGTEISRYVTGKTGTLGRKVDLTLAANGFQRRILDKLRNVPCGALISYRALAEVAGCSNGARAVGNALHNNPVPIYVPCHRVISSDCGIGGYAGGGMRKLKLLHSEGFRVLDDRHIGVTFFGHPRTKIYCRLTCRTASRIDRTRILFLAGAEEAHRAGMRPCKVCRPDRERHA
jgi:methylated-DNA-[protein]-cysteine S-methyltransferase